MGLGGIGWQEMLVFGLIALLLFGKRLPEVMRSLGQGITEFKKGLRGIDTEVDAAARRSEQRTVSTSTSSPTMSSAPLEPVGNKYEG